VLSLDQAGGGTDSTEAEISSKMISAGLEIGGLRIPHCDKMIKGFQQNLLRKINMARQNAPIDNSSQYIDRTPGQS
jgi:hypothetical protein